MRSSPPALTTTSASTNTMSSEVAVSSARKACRHGSSSPRGSCVGTMIEQRMGEVAGVSIPLVTMADVELGHGHSWRAACAERLRGQLFDDEPLSRRFHRNGGDGLDG